MRISLLGPLEVSDAAGKPVRVGGYRVRALLILLALDPGRFVPAYALIDRLWPDEPRSEQQGEPRSERNAGRRAERPADAANSLQSLVSRLRTALRAAGLPDGVVESSAAGYRLAVPPDAVDAVVFEQRARAGSQALARGDAETAAETLRAALGQWRGGPLTDVAGEEFAFAPAARLAELRTAAVLDRVEADLALGAADAATIGELRELIAADPLAERPAALLMYALAAAARQSEALAVYRHTRDRLADHLGVDPSPRLEQAYLAVLRQEVKEPPKLRPKSEPRGTEAASRRSPTSFVGRAGDLAALLGRLRTVRLVTLTGPGGVGKTRLATEAAARLAAPAWLAELAPVSDPAKVASAVLDALGLRERSIARHAGDLGGAEAPSGPLDRLAGALDDRDAVLILDNCEHVIEAAAALAERLLRDCPGVAILATSREPLQIPGETLQVVAPLAADPAAALFADRAAAVSNDFELTAANEEAVSRICRALDGMPLAIELAAPWLGTLTAAQLAARLDDRFALLTGGSRTALPRHQTLRAVVDWSWGLLSEPERALYRRLAILPGGATLTAAERVCAGQPSLPCQAVLPALAGLVGKSILTAAVTEADGEPRYRMLETVRAYGLDRLAEAGEDGATRDAAASYYLELAETADPLLRSRTQARWFRTLAAEQDNMNAAIRWAVGNGDAVTALRFIRALGYYGVQRGFGDADVLSREVLRLPSPPPTREVAEARVICALLSAGWGWNIELIREPLNEAMAVLDRFRDERPFHPLVYMAEPLLMQYDGFMDVAAAQFEFYTSVADPWLRGAGQISYVSYACSLGKLDGAEERCREGIATMRALGEQWGVAVGLTLLADFAELRGDHAAAAAALTEATALGREISVWGDLAYVQGRLGIIHPRAGDLDRGRAELIEARRAAQARGGQVDTDRWVAFMFAELASLAGDHAEAARVCEAVLASATELGAAWWQSLRAQLLARRAVSLLRLGDRERCGRLLAEAIDAAASWQEHPALAAVLDACAVYVLAENTGSAAERAARLLGAAHATRGAFDESSLDAPPARAASRAALGPPAFEAAYTSNGDLGYEAATALARALTFAS